MTLRMFESQWSRLWHTKPGRRFQNLYRRIHRNHANEDVTTHIVRFGLALVFLCVGVILIFLPLVYIPFLLASAALFASESVTFARFLDRTEQWSRNAWARFHAYSPRGAAAAATTFSVGCIGMAIFACYRAFVR
jgi:uncharacterized membrane protein YbaN (DUF454 family)